MTTCLEPAVKIAPNLQAALWLRDYGYSVFPCQANAKPPATANGLTDATTDEATVWEWFEGEPRLNVAVRTDGLVVLDVDAVDGQPNEWLTDERASLLDGVPSVITPRGGRHFYFRQPEGKTYRNTASRIATGVDTRADGGYVLVPPSTVAGRPYQWAGEQIDCEPENLPELPDWLAAELERPETVAAAPAAEPVGAGSIPAGQRNSTLARLAGHMRRAGMTEGEILAALNAANISRCSPPMDAREVRQIAWSVARYEPDQMTVALVEGHADECVPLLAGELPARGPADPGPIPESLLGIPGFVNEVRDFCLETAPYPNPVMAFAGALSLQSFLAGRKVRDGGDIRPNIYLLGLAHSASGKDWPRKLNVRILHETGQVACVGDRFSSGEGLEDTLFLRPAMLFQTDEIDGMLQSVNKAKDARYENVMGTLLTMYSTANSLYPMRKKAGKEESGVIDQPSVTIFGTAIPTHYYSSLSERMLTNGFFSRMIVMESGARCPGQDARILEPPKRVLDTAHWWANFKPCDGNVQWLHPIPTIVASDGKASTALAEARTEADAAYAKAEEAADAVGTTVWGRANEHIRKLAMLYAISERPHNPTIGADAVAWAKSIVMHLIRRMLFMAASNVAHGSFHAECLKVCEKLRAAGGELPHSVLLKRMKMDARRFRDITDTLQQTGQVEAAIAETSGRPYRSYRLRG